MLMSKLVEQISSTRSKEKMNEAIENAKIAHPMFRWLLALNDGEIEIIGVERTFEPHIIEKHESPYGRTLEHYWKMKTPFVVFNMGENALSYDPNRKKHIISNIANSIPFDEMTLFMTALRQELRVDQEPHPSVSSEKYVGIFSMMNKEDDKPVKVETVVTDNLVEGSPIADGLLPPEKEVDTGSLTPEDAKSKVSESKPAPKKRGRPKKVVEKSTEDAKPVPKKRGRPPKKK